MSFSQKSQSYSDHWIIIQDMIDKGNPKSALVEVDKLYTLAKKENNQAEIIKALVFQVDLKIENRENNNVLSIQELEKELAIVSEPAKSVLMSLIAQKYLNYYNQIRWKLYDRTATENFKKDDIATWSSDDFHEKIGALYLQSLQNEKLLKQTALTDFKPIITSGNTPNLRPTLFDLLAHEALGYFKSDERNIKKTTFTFEINSASAMDPAADFIHRKFETTDTTSLQFVALGLFQNLITFHINDLKPDALIDVDLERLQFVREHSVHPDKDDQYFLAINHIAHQYASTPAAAQAWYLVAAWHNERANTYEPNGDTTNRFENKKAVEICEKVIKENPKSEGGINAFNLLNNIIRSSISFTTENINIPNEPFRMLMEYKNLNKLYFRIYPVTEKFNLDNEYQNNKSFWEDIRNQKLIKKWDQLLPDTKDFQQHAVELKVDALPIGSYILVVSSNQNFDTKAAILAARQVYVSNISFIQKENHFFILNRETGAPLPNAKVTFWINRYDYTKRKSILREQGKATSDANGHVVQKAVTTNTTDPVQLEINYQKDHLFLNANTNTYYYQKQRSEESTKIWLFTDRGIYRPGQTVYYKGIIAEGKQVFTDSDKDISFVVSGPNGEEVYATKVRVNKYGSFSGKVKLPLGVLNGNFTIKVRPDKQDSHFSFNVEEYKRPKFEVAMDTLQGTFKVNQKITVIGAAKAYAGNVIDGAKVAYRVVRNPRYAYPWLSRRWFPRSEPVEIAHGVTETDANGKFAISFDAIPDLKLTVESDPIFDYAVYTDVTDINGETRSGETTVSVGYKSIVIKSNISSEMNISDLDKIKISTENLNGATITSEIKIKVSELTPEQRLIRKRLWKRPDVFALDKKTYIQLFPHDEYDQETEMENWSVVKEVFEQLLNTAKSQTPNFNKKTLKPGFYKIELETQDKDKQKVKDIKYVEIKDSSNLNFNKPTYLAKQGSKTIEPGEKTNIQIGSSASDVFVIQTSKWNSNQTLPFDFFKLNKEQKSFEFLATENDRGGYYVDYAFVKHNRFYTYRDFINIPWTNKDLNISYETFRDKTLPGSAEKWKVKITGYKKELVAAEMLASMYDASLDQFYPFQWNKPNPWQSNYSQSNWNDLTNFQSAGSSNHSPENTLYRSFDKRYDKLIQFQNYGRRQFRNLRGGFSEMQMSAAPMAKNNEEVEMDVLEAAVANESIGLDAGALNKVDKLGYGSQNKKANPQPIQVRTNFNETAFFTPDLYTNKKGEIEFSFTMPDALTRWKFQALAHTSDLAFGYSSKEIITQKELMVQPNAPRFVRQGDHLFFSTKVVNLTDKTLQGNISFNIRNSANDEVVDVQFQNTKAKQTFTVAAGQSTSVLFPITIPINFNEAITWRVTATSGDKSDAEENTTPVLSNRLLVTESLPIFMNGNGEKKYKFEKLLNSKNSKSLTNQSLTVEYTSNPTWYAIQALPYLMEYPYDCAEQTWNRYFANSMASHIVGSSPKIAAVFKTWQNLDTTALISNLQKNQELKSLLIEETPWVLAAKSETEQKKNIALLFDLVKMSNQLSNTIDKLRQMQSPNGGFVWFKGGPDDRYMTQYILSGIGHLQKAKAIQHGQEDYMSEITNKAIPYLDRLLKEDYEELKKLKTDLKKYSPSSTILYYLYMRSFYMDMPIPKASLIAYTYFLERAGQTWIEQSKYMQGLTALATFRNGDKKIPLAILKSLKETAVQNEELGMYWKQNNRGWWWYEAPIEQQALLIEAFQEIDNDVTTVNSLKTWLLKNKQTTSWESTKATAEACYALILQGSNWLASDPAVSIKLGNEIIKPNHTEAGTGYIKTITKGEDVKSEMGKISVKVTSDNPKSTPPSWGAVYWQYFEDMDKITFAETPLKLNKQLFLIKNTDKGEVLTPVKTGDEVHIGDKIKVRIELRADRDMEYVHMKDLRASAMEPVNVISSYKYQGGLGYYESTKDASTNFFFNYLRKGTYVFEYLLFVTHSGDFSNGITSIQCMYAPEFTAHSEGVRLKVK